MKHEWQQEEDADIVATNFPNHNSLKIKEITGWRDEWEIEEEY